MQDHDKRKNPWLGLESYREGEVLYGRDDDIRDLGQSVLNDSNVLLYGKSGIGKSSILNAGVIPAMRRHGFLPVPVRLSHKDSRGYLVQIHEAIAAAIIPPREGEDAAARAAVVARCIREVVPVRDPSAEGLYEYFHRHTFHAADGSRLRILLIIDQFEEIFTLQSDESAKKAFFLSMADMLNDVVPAALQQAPDAADVGAPEAPVETASLDDDIFDGIDLGDTSGVTEYVNDNDIHFVFTIREDFLSEFEYYTAAIPSLKQNRYGLRPINEEQAAQIILRPQPGLISPDVAKLIIEKVTGRSDFELDGVPEIEVDSAVLSLYLNRLYDAKDGEHITAALVEQKGGEIIADFYHEAIASIRPRTVEYLEDMLLNGQGRRDNITVYDAIHDGGVSEEELDTLCDRKKILRRFNYAGDLRIEYVHDILCPVVKEHKDERLLLRAQEEERRRQEEALAAEKAKRHQLELKAAAERRRNRRKLVAAVGAVVLLVAGFIGYYWYYETEHEAYYAGFERVDGWPVGIGPELTAEQRASMPLYYKLSHRGHLPHHTDVEVLSSNPRLPLTPRIAVLGLDNPAPADSVGRDFADKLARVARIHFVEGEGGKIDKEILFDSDDRVLYITNYFHLGNGRDAWLQYVQPSGQPMEVTSGGIDRVKLTWLRDSADLEAPGTGRIGAMRFFDASGVSRPASDSISGYEFRYGADGSQTRYDLDEYGTPALRRYNVTTISPDGRERSYARVYALTDTVPVAAPGPGGFAREVSRADSVYLYAAGASDPTAVRVVSRDARGNILSELTSGQLPPTVPAAVRYTYDDATGYMTSMERTGAAGHPFVTPADSVCRIVRAYTPAGETALEERYYPGDRLVYSRSIDRSRQGVTVERLDDRLHGIAVMRADSTLPGRTVTAWYDLAGKPAMHTEKEGYLVTSYHKKDVSEADGTTVKRYYRADSLGRVEPAPTVLDRYGQAVSYFMREESYDPDGNLRSYRILDTDGHVLKSMMYFYQSGQAVGRSVMGVDGTPVRCPRWEEEGYAYYKLYYVKNFADTYVSVRPVDETETPSAFYDPYGAEYLKVTYRDYRKEGYQLVKEQRRLDMKSPYFQFSFEPAGDVTDKTLPYLHILDKASALYAAGLRDGDRIVALGSWRLGQSDAALAAEWERARGRETAVEVLRPQGQGLVRLGKTVTISPAEAPLEEYHVLALSHRELTQFNDFISKLK